MRTTIFAITLLATISWSYAASPTPKEVLQQEIGSTITAMNSSGHPIFISSCRSEDDNNLVLIIASHGKSGLQVALNKDDVITSLSEITTAPDRSDFLVEADGGVSSQANAERILKVLKMRPFHLVERVTLNDLMNPKDKSMCAIKIGIK